MTSRSQSPFAGALRLILAATLVACGGTDPPEPPALAGPAGSSVKLPRSLDVTIEPSGPHPLLPTEGFGRTVALSGARIAVADYLDWYVQGLSFPHVDTFDLVDGQPVPIGKLPDIGYGEQCFGRALALDGDLLAVGAPCADGFAGAVQTYRLTSGGWVEEPRLLPPPEAAGGQFGSALAMAANRLVVGAPLEPRQEADGTVSASVGAAYVYARAGGAWRLSARLAASDGAPGDALGTAVSMAASTIAVGAPGRWVDDGTGSPAGTSGRAYVFTLAPDGSWGEAASLQVTDGASGEWIGRRLALCSGALFTPADAWEGPSVHAFFETDGGWVEGDLAEPSEGLPPVAFVDALACDGGLLVVGRPFASPAELAWRGEARVFKKLGGAWGLLSILPGAAAGDRAGHAVAVDNGIVAIGSPSAVVGERALGAVRVLRP